MGNPHSTEFLVGTAYDNAIVGKIGKLPNGSNNTGYFEEIPFYRKKLEWVVNRSKIFLKFNFFRKNCQKNLF